MDLFHKALSYACSSIWKDECTLDYVFSSSCKAFDELRQNCTKGRRLFRLAGQSGSGKTSQLFAATSSMLCSANCRPMHFAVRNFSKFFPGAESICQNANFREITNGFSLKVLICTLKKAFDEGYDIILEIALLDKAFEKFVFAEAKSQNYFQIFQTMSVSSLLTNAFTIKREKTSKRVTSISSQSYFYKTMLSSIKYISKRYSCKCLVWSAFELEPVFCGDLKRCRKAFFANLKRIEKINFDEKELLESKIKILKDLCLDELV